MKRNIFLLLVCMFVCCTAAFAQIVTLTFTAKDAANNHVLLDHVTITNLTKGWQETIYWPDTVLTMQNGTGIDEYTHNGGFDLSQNNPNPFTGSTEVCLTVAKQGEVTVDIADVNGKIVGTHIMRPQPGIHQFRITLSTVGTYVMTARQSGQKSSIKMVCNGGGDGNHIEYTGSILSNDYSTKPTKSNLKGATTNPFNFGDQMEYVGYASINGTEAESEHITQVQNASQTLTLQFSETQQQTPIVITNEVSNITHNSATVEGSVIFDGGRTITARGVCWSITQNPTINDSHTTDGSGMGYFTSEITNLSPITRVYVRAYATNSAGTAYGNQLYFTTAGAYDAQPCPDAATVTDYDNNVYNTVQIGNQCWMKESLRTTHYANGTSIALGGTSTSSTTAYCYYPGNHQYSVSAFGYLYNWKAVMGDSSSSSANPSGVQGICPTGWHVPSDAEWTQLMDYVSSQSQYLCGGDSTYIAKALASEWEWYSVNNTYTCAVGNNLSNNNETGFSAFPAGYYYPGTGYDDYKSKAIFWSTTEHPYQGSLCYCRCLTWVYAHVIRTYDNKSYGYSVRCLRD